MMRSGEKGFTLIEMLIASTITAVMAVVIGLAIFQVYRNTEINRNHTNAVHQVENAGYWISRDVQQANTIITSESLSLPDFLQLSWTGFISDDEYEVSYTLEDMPGSDYKKLMRYESINDGANTTSQISLYIDADPTSTSCNVTSDVFYLNITATAGEGSWAQSEYRTYLAVTRLD